MRLNTYAHEPGELLGAIDRLLADEELRPRLQAEAARLQASPGTRRAAELIEALA